MASLALSATATLSLFPRMPEKKMFPPNGWKKKTSPFCAKPRRGEGPKCEASASTGSSGGVVSQGGDRDPRLYAWPDKKKPRICILGGGFGGLYTALRLESLIWDDDKKPQKVSDRLKDLERTRFGKDSVIKVAVVGCGYSGVELAATLSERLQDRGRVQAINVETTILPNAPTGIREVALKVLSSRKVQLLLGSFVRSIRRVTDPEVAVNGVPENKKSDRYYLELQPVERRSENQYSVIYCWL